ncbi:hypothetical protein BJ878DRAFT_579425 [Calycina marina]|uniref:Amidohydrolase 3 domain-containing protein n=1 Tax=Calycina marina TaxID=1763456 RepID=A0A9P7YVN9_9HELO|nr:hypothetical protein BJ878DRAFT_579425 [Calycina marina]
MRSQGMGILEGMAIKAETKLEYPVSNTFCPDGLVSFKTLEEGVRSDGISNDKVMLYDVELFADGALGSLGAALLESYNDKHGVLGAMLISRTELTSVVKQWDQTGWQVNMHAIGYKANHAAINAFEAVLGANCYCLRPQTPEDKKRAAMNSLIPSIHPTHAASDMAHALDRLCPNRLRNSAYRMASFLLPQSHRAQIPTQEQYQSDFPVEPPNPFHGLSAAIAHLHPITGTSPLGLGG